MAITEHSRRRLYQHLEVTIGEEPAMTLMEHLPPMGWADVATKHDLDHLREIMATRQELAELRAEMYRALRSQTGMIAAMLTVLFAALKLT